MPVTCHEPGQRDLSVHTITFGINPDGTWHVRCGAHPGDPILERVSAAFTEHLDPRRSHCLNHAAVLVESIAHAADVAPDVEPWVIAETAAAVHYMAITLEPVDVIVRRARAMQESGFRPWVWWQIDPTLSLVEDLAAGGHRPDVLADWLRTTGPYGDWMTRHSGPIQTSSPSAGQHEDPTNLADGLRLWASLGVRSPAEARRWVDVGVNGGTLCSAVAQGVTCVEDLASMQVVDVEGQRIGLKELSSYQARWLGESGAQDHQMKASGLNAATYDHWSMIEHDHDTVVSLAESGYVSTVLVAQTRRSRPDPTVGEWAAKPESIEFGELLALPRTPISSAAAAGPGR